MSRVVQDGYLLPALWIPEDSLIGLVYTTELALADVVRSTIRGGGVNGGLRYG